MIRPRREFMELAIEEALSSRKRGDCAIGAVIVRYDEIISRAGNCVKLSNDPTAHAEIVAMREECKKLFHC